MMKKVIILMALTFTVAAFGFAQTTTATASITLSGTIEKNVAISATGVGNYDSLDLTVDVTDLAVVQVNEYSNVREGYSVSLSSSNATAGNTADPFFAGQTGGESLSYSIAYDGSAVSFSGGSAQITDANDKTPLAGTDKNLTITYAGAAANLGNDTYTDDLTFTITAK